VFFAFFKKLPKGNRHISNMNTRLPFGNFLKNRKLTIVLAPARCAATRRRRRARVGAVWWGRPAGVAAAVAAGVAAGVVPDASRSSGASREAVG
jgi:hypothetical protein